MSVPQERLRAIIFCGWRCGTGATVTVRNVNSTLEGETTSINIVYRWFSFYFFKRRDKSFEEKPRSGLFRDSAILGLLVKEMRVGPSTILTRIVSWLSRGKEQGSIRRNGKKCRTPKDLLSTLIEWVVNDPQQIYHLYPLSLLHHHLAPQSP